PLSTHCASASLVRSDDDRATAGFTSGQADACIRERAEIERGDGAAAPREDSGRRYRRVGDRDPRAGAEDLDDLQGVDGEPDVAEDRKSKHLKANHGT